MSKLDIINTEITRREQANLGLIEGQQELINAIEQFNQLDELYRTDEKVSRERLECLYGENRHFTGKQPIVYSFSQTEFYPFVKGATDAECNPYFPITKIQDGTFDGLAPLFAPPTRTGAFQRDQDYAPTEDVPRSAALTELNNFPDISGEPLPVGWPGPQQNGCTGETPPGSGVDEPTCLANGGVWGPIPDPVWNGPDTAPALLRTALNNWKSDIQLIISDLCEDDGTEEAFWNSIIADIDVILPAVATDAVFVRATGNSDPAAWGQTQDFTPSSPEDIARSNLITAATTTIPNNVSSRTAFLTSEADTEEQVFFGIIKLRLHQANGSYAKLQAAKGQVGNNQALIDDNNDAISSLNLLKVKNS